MSHTQRPQFVFVGWKVELMRLENQSPHGCLSAALLLWRPWHRAATIPGERLWLDIAAILLPLLAPGAFCYAFP